MTGWPFVVLEAEKWVNTAGSLEELLQCARLGREGFGHDSFFFFVSFLVNCTIFTRAARLKDIFREGVSRCFFLSVKSGCSRRILSILLIQTPQTGALNLQLVLKTL